MSGMPNQRESMPKYAFPIQPPGAANSSIAAPKEGSWSLSQRAAPSGGQGLVPADEDWNSAMPLFMSGEQEIRKASP